MRCTQIAAMGMVGTLFGAGSLLGTAGTASATTATNTRPPSCVCGSDDAWPS